MTTKELYQLLKDEKIELDGDKGALLFIAAGESLCQALQGKGINIIAAIMMAMSKDEDLRRILFKAVDLKREIEKACKPSRWQRFLNLFKKSESSEE